MVSFDWSDIQSMCCLSYLETDADVLTLTELSSNVGRTFALGAFVEYTQTDGSIRRVRIRLEGYTSSIILNECDITVCETQEYTSNIAEALNILAFSEPSPVAGQQGVSSRLETSSLDILPITDPEAITDFQSNTGDLFDLLTTSGVLNAENFTGTQVDKWNYSGVINPDGNLVMTFTAFNGTTNLGAMTFTLELQGNSVTNIVRFSYVDANKERDNNGVLLHNPEQVLTIHTLLNTSGNPAYTDLQLNSTIPLMECIDYGYGKNEQN